MDIEQSILEFVESRAPFWKNVKPGMVIYGDSKELPGHVIKVNVFRVEEISGLRKVRLVAYGVAEYLTSDRRILGTRWVLDDERNWRLTP